MNEDATSEDSLQAFWDDGREFLASVDQDEGEDAALLTFTDSHTRMAEDRFTRGDLDEIIRVLTEVRTFMANKDM